ncbi:MAG TPA: 4,5-DOPA dioxygenase extradiol [Candidatus Baltobacteraceae bacterium]
MTHSAPMPVIFFGHGNPMNAIAVNAYAKKWHAMGRGLPKPKAVLSVSAHWYVEETAVTAMAQPRTIHDFGGFPRELYEVHYRAPGDPDLAARVAQLLQPATVRLDHDSWGLDHGTWSVLTHVVPDADIPVVQLSIDETKPPQFHYELAQRLAPLRDEGVLVIGSGNIVHNLHAYAWGRHPAQPFDWALRFEERVRELILDANHAPLVDYESLGRDALLSAPTPDHYLPLVYTLGLRRDGDQITFPVEGIDGGSISMLAVDMR